MRGRQRFVSFRGADGALCRSTQTLRGWQCSSEKRRACATSSSSSSRPRRPSRTPRSRWRRQRSVACRNGELGVLLHTPDAGGTRVHCSGILLVGSRSCRGRTWPGSSGSQKCATHLLDQAALAENTRKARTLLYSYSSGAPCHDLKPSLEPGRERGSQKEAPCVTPSESSLSSHVRPLALHARITLAAQSSWHSCCATPRSPNSRRKFVAIFSSSR
jgi:hypothetical protein